MNQAKRYAATQILHSANVVMQTAVHEIKRLPGTEREGMTDKERELIVAQADAITTALSNLSKIRAHMHRSLP